MDVIAIEKEQLDTEIQDGFVVELEESASALTQGVGQFKGEGHSYHRLW